MTIRTPHKANRFQLGAACFAHPMHTLFFVEINILEVVKIVTNQPNEVASRPLVRLREVSKDHAKGPQTVHVLRRVNLDIAAGEFVAIMGPSGAGKTTLLNMLGGLDRPSAGVVKVNGIDIDKLSRAKMASWRASNVGFIFQFYNLIPVLTARHNVELPLTLTKLDAASRRQRCEAALKLMGLLDRAKHYPNEMSGGEQQRIAIARAIVASPHLLLCDEPTGDLDRATGIQILDLLQMLCKEHGKTIIMVTHDPKAAEYATRRLYLENGNLSEQFDHDIASSIRPS
jgi:putative ABC transport system ATP-binding protein